MAPIAKPPDGFWDAQQYLSQPDDVNSGHIARNDWVLPASRGSRKRLKTHRHRGRRTVQTGSQTYRDHTQRRQDQDSQNLINMCVPVRRLPGLLR